ncbi:MAG: TVP38/TMEM64 family protein [Cyanobacteria bacterium P01_E01_bin.6]
MKPVHAKWSYLALMGFMAVSLWASPLRHLLLQPDEAIHKFQMMGIGAGLLFAFAHVVATVLWFPGSVLVIAGGAVFGIFWGTVWSVLGATVGAIIAFWLARYLLRDWVKQRFQNHPLLRRVNQTVRKHSLRCVFVVRFAPISPFTIINFVFGVTPIHVKPYAVGTFLGIIPGTLLYTWVGATGQQALHGENISSFLLAVALLTLLSLLPLLMRSRQLSSED